jgi:hypothetical protein
MKNGQIALMFLISLIISSAAFSMSSDTEDFLTHEQQKQRFARAVNYYIKKNQEEPTYAELFQFFGFEDAAAKALNNLRNDENVMGIAFSNQEYENPENLTLCDEVGNLVGAITKRPATEFLFRLARISVEHEIVNSLLREQGDIIHFDSAE